MVSTGRSSGLLGGRRSRLTLPGAQALPAEFDPAPGGPGGYRRPQRAARPKTLSDAAATARAGLIVQLKDNQPRPHQQARDVTTPAATVRNAAKPIKPLCSTRIALAPLSQASRPSRHSPMLRTVEQPWTDHRTCSPPASLPLQAADKLPEDEPQDIFPIVPTPPPASDPAASPSRVRIKPPVVPRLNPPWLWRHMPGTKATPVNALSPPSVKGGKKKMGG